MTQEQKDLLIKDLCGRLPHGVKCKILETNEVKILSAIQYDGENTLFDFWEDDQKIHYGYQLYLSEFKPCLLPLSSMTEEQKHELKMSTCPNGTGYFNKYSLCCPVNHFGEEIPFDFMSSIIDHLNKNHFDYRGLIPIGLANDATGLNIY